MLLRLDCRDRVLHLALAFTLNAPFFIGSVIRNLFPNVCKAELGNILASGCHFGNLEQAWIAVARNR